MACEICQGSKRVRLPVYHRTGVREHHSDVHAIHMRDSFRDYPCPECQARVPESAVTILQRRDVVRIPMGDQEDCRRHVERNIAQAFVQAILEAGHMQFTWDDREKDLDGRLVVWSRIGVVSRQAVATIEDRVKSYRQIFAETLVKKATRKILHWGSHYTGATGPIEKGMAARFVEDALEEVRADPPPVI